MIASFYMMSYLL